MKKTALILLSILMLFSLCACGDKEEEPSTVPATQVTEPATQALPLTGSSPFPTDAYQLPTLPSFNGYKAEFAYSDGVLYVALTDENSKEPDVISLPLTSDINESTLAGEGVLLVSDMNFDGYTDVGLLYSAKNNANKYYCFLWNVQNRTLTYNEALSILAAPTFDKEEQKVGAMVTVGDKTKRVYYEWIGTRLSELPEEEVTEEPTTMELTADAIAEAVYSLFGIEKEAIKEYDDTTINGSPAKVFSISTENGTVHIAADTQGYIFIDENRDGKYQTLDKKNGTYIIGASLNSGYSEKDYITHAKALAAGEVGKENVGDASVAGSDYVNDRLVTLYRVSIFEGNGHITVAFDDTMQYSYLMAPDGEFNKAELTAEPATEEPTTEEATTEEPPVITPEEDPTEEITTENADLG